MTEKSDVGMVNSKQAWEALTENSQSVFIDVRTKAEWAFVGIPVLSKINKNPLFIEWREFPDMNVNEDFVNKVKSVVTDLKTPIYFICKGGGRSNEAAHAIAAEGYENCFNIVDGFEGEPNNDRHRGTISGWKASNLPWEQN